MLAFKIFAGYCLVMLLVAFLRSVLREPVANAEFNKCINEITSPGTLGAATHETQLKILEDQLASSQKETELLLKRFKKMQRFVNLLGRVIEPQVHLTQYTVDTSEKKTYTIQFGADQIRLALRLYWEAIAEVMENAIARVASTADPSDGDENET